MTLGTRARLGVAAALTLLCAQDVAHAAECQTPTPACGALLDEVAAECLERPRSCRLHVDLYEAVEQCARVEKAARVAGAPVLLSLVSAYRESGFDRYAVSSVGAVGIMQIRPRYWCEAGTSCDTVEAGVRAIRDLVHRYGPVVGIAYYRSGSAALDGAGRPGARMRLRMVERVKRRVANERFTGLVALAQR